jgi:hypothetical protein
MFATEFTYVNNTYRLVVDSTLAVKTAAWLESQGVVFDRYFKHEGFCKFIFISAPDKAIALITAKYPLPVETLVEEPTPERVFVAVGNSSDIVYNSYYIQCKTPEDAITLQDKLHDEINTCWSIHLDEEHNRIYFQDPDYYDGMYALYNELVNWFGVPVRTCPDTSPYYFSDCNTPAEVKAKYRKLSKIHHPNLGGNSETLIVIANQYQEAMTSLS